MPSLPRRLAIALSALLLVTVTMITPAGAATDEEDWPLEDLGPASVATPTGSGAFIGDVLWFSTRNTSPVAVIGLDPATGQAVQQIELPDGAGAWVTGASGTDLYVGTYTPGKVYRVDTLTGSVEQVLNVGSSAVVYALAVAPDGVVYVGTYASSGGRIFSYDPSTDTAEDLGVIVEGQDYVRALAVDQEHVYAGLGSQDAQLIRIDRSSRTVTDLTPDALDGATFVSSLALHDGAVLGGVSPRGQLVVVDTENPDRFELVQAPNETFVVAVTGAVPGDAYFAARPSGTLYRYPMWSGEGTAVAVPAPEKAANGLMFHNGLVWGLVNGSAYTYDPVSAEVTGYPLDAAGVPASPERPMTLAADAEHVYAPGSMGLQIHDIATGESTRIFVPGEAKSITPAGDTVYLSVYTRALLYALDPATNTLRKLAEIGHEQTRPRDSHYAAEVDRLLVGTEPDYGKYGGALSVYDPQTEDLDVYRDIIADQSISAVTSIGDVAYIGSDIRSGLGTDPVATMAEIAAVDVYTGEILWSLDAPEQATRITDLVAVDGELVGITSTGLLFGVDPNTEAVTWTQQAGTRGGSVTPTDTGIYTTDGDTVFRISWSPGATAPDVEEVVGDLDGGWYGPPTVAATPDGNTLYTMRARNLVSVTAPDRLHATVDVEAGAEPVGSGADVWRAHATVGVYDAYGDPMRGVRVEGEWLQERIRRAVCVTGPEGTCRLRHTVRGRDSVELSLNVLHHRALPGGKLEVGVRQSIDQP